MKYTNRLNYKYQTHNVATQRRRNLHAITGLAKKSDGHLRKLRASNDSSNLKTLKAWVGDENHYVCPAYHQTNSIIGKVTTEVKALQAIVDAIVTQINKPLVSAALSRYSEVLILAVGIAATQRLLDDETLPATEADVRLALYDALETRAC